MAPSPHDLLGRLGARMRAGFDRLVSAGTRSPQGFLGLRWGDDPGDAAARLGLDCQSWTPWEGAQGYEACFDIDRPVNVFGRNAYARLIRRENRLEGLSLRFTQCGAARSELAGAVRSAFHLESGEGDPYRVYPDGSVVHLGYDGGDDTCTLTVAGPRFGRVFARYLLQQGFSDLSGRLTAR